MAKTKKNEVKNGSKGKASRVKSMVAPIASSGHVKRNSTARVTPTPRGLVVSNTEFAFDVSQTGTAGQRAVFGYSFNPATADFWLTNIAKNYQFYKILELCWTYVPFCPTTTGGIVEEGLFTNFEQFLGWYNSGVARDLSKLGQYNAFPPWGGALNSSMGTSRDPLTIVADVKMIHRQREWFVVDEITGSTDFAREQQAIGVSLGLQTTSGGTAQLLGKIFVSYKVEFEDPVRLIDPSTLRSALSPLPNPLPMKPIPVGDPLVPLETGITQKQAEELEY